METLSNVVGFVNGIIWSKYLVFACLAIGLYFTLRTGVVQVRRIGTMIRLMKEGQSSSEGISSFQSLCTALAGRIGTGNIVGTATAIFYGGPGALFWMWMLAFLGAASAYVESTLGQIYKIKVDGQYRGGPSYYIEKGLKQKWYAVIFAIATLLGVGIFLPGVQSNAIASAFNNATGVPEWVVGAIVAAVLGIIIFGGIKRIARVAEMVVPFMAIIYILMALVILFANIDRLGEVFRMIFASAFGADQLFGGVLGSAIMWGVKRGVYSNEAGQGTQPHAAGAAEVSHPAKQGLVQAFGVYIDTLFVCSATGFMLLMTDCFNVVSEKTGELIYTGSGAANMADVAYSNFTQTAVTSFVGDWGSIFVAVCLALFAFTTILSYYYQAESNIAYLFKNAQSTRRTVLTQVLRVAMLLVVFGAVVLTADQVWDIGDIGVGLMAWLNLIAIVLLQKPALLALKDYEAQEKLGLDPVFDPEKLGIKNADVWKEIVAEKYANLNAGKTQGGNLSV